MCGSMRFCRECNSKNTKRKRDKFQRNCLNCNRI